MADMTPELETAFRCLGVEPDADRTTIRAAWRALARAYHPDQVSDDKSEANRRLAEMNAAFDLISAWTPEDARAYAAARAQRQQAARKAWARQAETKRKADQTRREQQRQAEAQAAEERDAQARDAAERAERARADALDQQQTATRTAQAHRAKQRSKVITARAKFLAALRELTPGLQTRELGFL